MEITIKTAPLAEFSHPISETKHEVKDKAAARKKAEEMMERDGGAAWSAKIEYSNGDDSEVVSAITGKVSLFI